MTARLIGPEDLEELDRAEREALEGASIPEVSGTSATAVLDQWAAEGPLVHEPTGLVELDLRTGGGPVYGSRWYIVGAPDAGKTALLVQLADVYARRGICVGLLAVDEEPDDLVIRLGQRAGFARIELERRSTETLGLVREALQDLPVRFYGAEHTIESAARALAAWAEERGSRAVLGIDSIQSVTCAANLGDREGRPPSAREVVSANVQALRTVATHYNLIAVATSEMNRAAYRSKTSRDDADDLASGAESRAIEFSARVLLALRSVAGESDLAELRLAKNKHGPGWRGEQDSVFLKLDRPRMTFSEGPLPSKSDAAAEDLSKNRARIEADAVVLADIVRLQPGIGERGIRASLKLAGHKWGVTRVDVAKALLERGFNGQRLIDRGTKPAVAWHLETISDEGDS